MIERKRCLLLWIAAILAFGWRLASPWRQQSAVLAGDLSELDHTMFVTLGVMGLGFIACGLIAHHWAGTRASWLFALYAAFAGLHWGGPLGVSTKAWIVYLFVSGLLSEALLLHFALVFPRPLRPHLPRWMPILLYGPVAVSGLVAATIVALTPQMPAAQALTQVFWGLHATVPNLFAVLTIVVVGIRFARATPAERRADGLTFLLLGMVFGVGPYLGVLTAGAAGVELPGGPEPYNLFFILIPIGFCAAILRHRASSHQKAATP